MVREAADVFVERDGRLTSSRDRVSSSRRRLDIPPTALANEPVQLVTYCDPAGGVCQASISLNDNFPDVFGSAVQTALRPIATANDRERTIAACAIHKLKLQAVLHMRQLSAPQVDGKRHWLTPDEIYSIATAANIEEETITRLREVECPADIEKAEGELRALGAPLVATTFVNGRPSPSGRLTEARTMIMEELKIAEEIGDRLSPQELRALLLRYDNQEPFFNPLR